MNHLNFNQVDRTELVDTLEIVSKMLKNLAEKEIYPGGIREGMFKLLREVGLELKTAKRTLDQTENV